jgi:very-short-patch-repair endonuclease
VVVSEFVAEVFWVKTAFLLRAYLLYNIVSLLKKYKMSLENLPLMLKGLVKHFNSSASNDIIPLLNLCESPLEQEFLFSLFECMGQKFEYVKENSRIVGGRFTYSLSEISVIPQYWIGNYRADFVIIQKMLNAEKRYGIECDSWQYHSKESQKKRDFERDVFYEQNGYEIISLSGDQLRAWRGCGWLVRSILWKREQEMKSNT